MEPHQLNIRDVAKAMSLDDRTLVFVAENVERLYKPRRIQNIGGKQRPIDAMYNRPKRWFKKLHRFFQSEKLYHPNAHGGVRRRSTFTSAKIHAKSKYVWKLDIKDCYPSISRSQFFDEMLALRLNQESASLLSILCTVRGGIPQGSPISNDALNLYLWRLDQLIYSACGQHQLRSSRIADDIVISGDDRKAGFDVVQRIEKALNGRGLQVNQSKRDASGFQTKDCGVLVHNINLDNKCRTKVSKEHHGKIIELSDRFLSGCKSVQSSSIESVAAMRISLSGWKHYCRQADSGPIRHIEKMIDAGDRAVLRKLRDLKISTYKNKWWLKSPKRDEPKRIIQLWNARVSATQTTSLSDL